MIYGEHALVYQILQMFTNSDGWWLVHHHYAQQLAEVNNIHRCGKH